ncbi:MAG: hypothetical protein K0R18_1524 [Bacillales bacterium]|jgi:uncharacterized membrane protein YphA (DoxX/SURF4 family)|nr:hypothetical protein [Bacillales bacterium]
MKAQEINMLIIVFKITLIVVFLSAGSGKLAGANIHIEDFKNWQLPQWFRILTGLVEILGAMILFISFWVKELEMFGALWFVGIGIGGIITHIRANDDMKDTFSIVILFLIAASTFLLCF